MPSFTLVRRIVKVIIVNLCESGINLGIPRSPQDKHRLYPHLDEQPDESKSLYHQDKPDHPFQISHHLPETA